MKKVFILLLIILLTFCGCRIHKNTVGDDSMINHNTVNPYISLNSLNVYKVKGNFIVSIYMNNSISNIVEFSCSRKSKILNNDIKLLADVDIDQYLGMNMDQIIYKYGQPHTDIGSGFYIPAYITENGYLIYFKLSDNIIFEVIKMDLLNNMVVETKEQ